MFTIDNNQVIINCKLLGGSDQIHMKNVRNYINKLVGGDVTKNVLNKTLTNIYNMTGGADVVSKKTVKIALDQVGGSPPELLNDNERVKYINQVLKEMTLEKFKTAHAQLVNSGELDLKTADSDSVFDEVLFKATEGKNRDLETVVDQIGDETIKTELRLKIIAAQNKILLHASDMIVKNTNMNENEQNLKQSDNIELIKREVESIKAALSNPDEALDFIKSYTEIESESETSEKFLKMLRLSHADEILDASGIIGADLPVDKLPKFFTGEDLEAAKGFYETNKKVLNKHTVDDSGDDDGDENDDGDDDDDDGDPYGDVIGGAATGYRMKPANFNMGLFIALAAAHANVYLRQGYEQFRAYVANPASAKTYPQHFPWNESPNTDGVKDILQKIIYIIDNQINNTYGGPLKLKYDIFVQILVLCTKDGRRRSNNYPMMLQTDELKRKVLTYLKSQDMVGFETDRDFGEWAYCKFTFNINKVQQFYDNNSGSQIGGKNELTEFVPITYSLTGGGVREINLSNFMLEKTAKVVLSAVDNEQMIINLIDAISSDWDFEDIDDFWNPNDLVPEDLAKQDFWQRDSNGKLQYKDKNDNVITLSQFFINNANSNNVVRVGQTADAFNFGCWMNGSSIFESFECQKQFRDMQSVIDFTQEQVNKMYPLTIFSILKSLGMKGEYQTDDEGKEYMVIQNPSEWWDSLNDKQKKTLSHKWNIVGIRDFASTINQQINATTLETFSQYDGRELIKKMRNFINANPAIINKDYKMASANKKLNQVRSPVTGVMSRLNLPHTQPIPAFANMFNSALGDYGRMLGTNMLGLSNVFGLPNVSSQAMIFGHTGGYEKLDTELIGGVMNLNIVGPPMFSRQIRRMYELFKSRLNAHKKKLTPSTDKKIDDLIKTLESKEKQLKKLLAYFRAYTMVVNADSDFEPENITITHLQNAMSRVSSRFSKYRTRAVAAADILNALHGAVKDTSGVSMPLNINPDN